MAAWWRRCFLRASVGILFKEELVEYEVLAEKLVAIKV
jgi:hypothetical protein